MSKTKKTTNRKIQKHHPHQPLYQPRCSKTSTIFVIGGGILLGIGLSILLAIYSPVVFQEIRYTVKPGSNKTVIRPVDEQFGIVIPKIGANSKIIADVSPFNEKEYQVALTKGVAQARDTAKPGEYGNMFIFAHSAANWINANRYNAIFYLLSKLKIGDSVYIFYKGQKYLYEVTQKKLVSSNALEYLKQNYMKRQLTLMTCWPPGTTLQRLIVTADLVSP